MLVLLLAAPLAWADFPATANVNGAQLPKSSEGLLRWKGLFKVYEAALYKSPVTQGYTLGDGSTLRLELHYLRDLSAQDLVAATQGGFERVLPPGEGLARWQGELDKTLKTYRNVSRGDRYGLEVWPQGYRLTFNGEPVLTGTDEDYARRLLGLWLLPETPVPTLRSQLLVQR